MKIFLWIVNILCMAFSAYFVVTCLFGLLIQKKKRPGSPSSCRPNRRIAAVIAARNEEAVIGELVASLLRQDYPRELFDVYVVPNNCTDRTEQIARQAGARILTCDCPVRSKGDALRCAFSQLTEMETAYDAYCVFDADNLVDPSFFQAVCSARENGYQIAQGYRDSKNPYASWVSGSMSVFYWFMSRFYNGSRAALGMSCALNGTGFMVSDSLIRRLGWNTVTLTEDLEFSAQCALNNVKIGWMPNARVYDEQPVTLKSSLIQRRRWSAGSLQCFRRYAGELFAHRSIHSFDMAMLFTGMLLNLFGLASGAITTYLLVRMIASNPQLVPSILLVGAVSVVACVLGFSMAAAFMYALERKLCARALPAIALFSLFMLTWIVVNLCCFITRAPQWDAIKHTGSFTVAE